MKKSAQRDASTARWL